MTATTRRGRFHSYVACARNRNIAEKANKAVLRYRLWLEQAGYCALCGDWLPLEEATFEHIVPQSRGGSTTWGNGLATCQPCNSYKAHSMALAYETYPVLRGW